MKTLSISQLFVYPVKSTGGLNVSSLELDSRGPKFDRHWMLVDGKNRFLTQRKHPKMCMIGTVINGQSLILTAPDKAACEVSGSTTVERIVQVWNDEVIALDCGDEVAGWLSDYLQKECRLVCMPEHSQRLVDPDFAADKQTVGFADGFPTMLVSQSSLDDFNSKLDSPIGMDRFRPNIVIDGCEPYAEDSWKQIQIGEITFSIVKPCARCIIPSINQQTGIKQPEIIDALNTHRRRDNKTFFGQNAVHNQAGDISVGDAVILLRKL
jgi:uncharacterized protein YcbX